MRSRVIASASGKRVSGLLQITVLSCIGLNNTALAQADILEDTNAGVLVSSAEEGRLPELHTLLGMALVNDSDLSRQRYELLATEQEVDMAWSRLKPHVTLGGAYTYQESDNYYTDNPDYDPGSEVVNNDYEARYEGQTRDRNWQVSLSQPLFSIESWRKVDEADAQVEASRLEVAVGESELAMSVVDAYLGSFLSSRKVALLDSKRKSLELQLKQAKRSYELGIGDRLNVLEARSRLDQSVADRVKAENELENSLGELERLTGVRAEFGDVLGDLRALSLPKVEGGADDWLTRVTNNLEVKLAAQELKIARANISTRRAGHYPEVTLNMSYSDRDSNDPYRESTDAQASVQFELPLYEGGYTSANVRQGEYAVKASESTLTNARRLARQRIRESLRNIQGGLQQLAALGESIDSSRLFLEAAEKGEQLGLRDLVDVLDARAELYDLRIQYVDGLRQYLFSRLELEVAVGDLDTGDLTKVVGLLNSLVAGSGHIDGSQA